MPCAYVHLSVEDRRKIARWHDARMLVHEVAARLGRHRATIHHELKRNRFVDAEPQELSGYYALNAQSKAEARRAGLRKLIPHRDLRDVVIDRIKTGWTLEQIAGGPAPVSFRSFESNTRHEGDRIWGSAST